jgi:hypothetical protein
MALFPFATLIVATASLPDAATVVIPSAPPAITGVGQNFTQYLCNGTDSLNWCENGQYDKCKVSTHAQGACLLSAGGHSLKAVCDSLDANVIFSLYETSKDCTGDVITSTELTDLCMQGGGGAYFVKLECGKQ